MTQRQVAEMRTVLTEAHKNYRRGLNLYAFLKINNQATSEDLVQDAFLKTWKYLMRGKKINAMRAFLRHVFDNIIIDEYRKRKTVSLDLLLGKGFEPTSTDYSPQRLFNTLDGKMALLLTKKLPKIYQQVLHLRYEEGLSLKEIAHLTNQSINTVAVQIHRGLRGLRKLYNRPPTNLPKISINEIMKTNNYKNNFDGHEAKNLIF